MDLRKPFWNTITKMADKDDKIRVLVGDLGFSFMEDFAKKHPDKFINMGICEQNMVGVACGMAIMGLKPYVYSGAKFLLTRANEQIRDDVGYNNLDVKLIGSGASGFLGFSHNFGKKEKPYQLLEGVPNISHVEPNEKQMEKTLTFNGSLFIKI